MKATGSAVVFGMTTPLQRVAGVLNAAVRPFIASRIGGRLVGSRMTVVSYTGRKSGRSFSIPVAYTRQGRTATIGVSLPDRKGWWRNFTGDGGPLSLWLDGTSVPGHATAHRDDQGQVEVSVLLDG